MGYSVDLTQFTIDAFRREARRILDVVRGSPNIDEARRRLYLVLSESRYEKAKEEENTPLDTRVINRDCTRSMRGILHEASDAKCGFSVMQALWDIAQGVERPDLQPGFYAQMIHLVRGVEGRPAYRVPTDTDEGPDLAGREAGSARSLQLDELAGRVLAAMGKYPDGLSKEAVKRRAKRRKRILSVLKGTDEDWSNWKWQFRNVFRDPDLLARAVNLSDDELRNAKRAVENNIPFAVTPYYASLMDDDPEAGRDRAVRAQVLPPQNYVDALIAHRDGEGGTLDFMGEEDTSPIDLVTRRYPNIVILKPFNTCPQICVYCQRNWEIDEAMSPHALAPWEKIEAACAWIEEHPAIHEVLVTGGDPLVLADATVKRVLGRVARIPHVDLIRIGTRLPVTAPMRITRSLTTMLGGFRELGRREIAVVTHVEHPYEITPELAEAIDALRRKGIGVYNQQVYTFYVSRRFETAKLRLLIRRIGIDPYYTFVPKGKEETLDYRVPIARLMQETKEEARLAPGLRRTDSAVYNVPRLGKNYMRAQQHRDLVSVLPDGSRVYAFHPWEKNVSPSTSYIGSDVPILEYLCRLAAAGENPDDYESIWYYF
ncbi:KamA family radical SAM protein [Candidatus Sumerlaeota bacterium]|nr:KamA family radical SAM protein [Candidatus Sumerlaeota bacterium]